MFALKLRLSKACLSFARPHVQRTYVATQQGHLRERAQQSEPRGKRVRVRVSCVGEASAASAPPQPAAGDALHEAAAQPPAPILPDQLGSEWLLLNTDTLTVHHCFTSKCVTSGCGRYLPFSSKAVRPAQLHGDGLITCALCFGSRQPLSRQ